jgi:hypothetical protein
VNVVASFPADAEAFHAVIPGDGPSMTHRYTPSPEPWASPRRAMCGRTHLSRNAFRYLSWSYPRSAYNRKGRWRGWPRRPRPANPVGGKNADGAGTHRGRARPSSPGSTRSSLRPGATEWLWLGARDSSSVRTQPFVQLENEDRGLSANQVAVALGVEQALAGTVGRGTVREPAGDTPENLCRLD